MPYLFFNVKDIMAAWTPEQIMETAICVKECPKNSEYQFADDSCFGTKKYPK